MLLLCWARLFCALGMLINKSIMLLLDRGRGLSRLCGLHGQLCVDLLYGVGELGAELLYFFLSESIMLWFGLVVLLAVLKHMVLDGVAVLFYRFDGITN